MWGERPADVDENLVSRDTAAVDRDRFGGGQPERPAGSQVEAGAMEVALDLTVAHVALGQRDGGVRALIGYRVERAVAVHDGQLGDRKSTRLNSSHANISYAVFCLKKKNLRVSASVGVTLAR